MGCTIYETFLICFRLVQLLKHIFLSIFMDFYPFIQWMLCSRRFFAIYFANVSFSHPIFIWKLSKRWFFGFSMSRNNTIHHTHTFYSLISIFETTFYHLQSNQDQCQLCRLLFVVYRRIFRLPSVNECVFGIHYTILKITK